MRLRRGRVSSIELVCLLAALTGAGCGSRITSGGQTDAIAVIEEDAGANHRGPLDGGDTAEAARPDLATLDALTRDGAVADAGARDTGGADLGGKVDAPVRQCTAPAVRCNGKSPESCSPEGLWQTSGTACQDVCAAGLCAGECLPGAYQCVGATRQLCDANGKWMDNLACPFVCNGTDCGGECLPARNRCVAGDLQTCSAMGAWQSVGTASRELLANPGFDGDDLIWDNPGQRIVYLANGRGGNNTPDVVAQSPTNLAWFGGINRKSDQLSQSVTIPANAASVTLGFYYWIITDEGGAGENDVFDVSLVDPAGAETPLAHLSDNNASNDWVSFKAAVPLSLAGKTVTLQLRGQTNATQTTSFYIDTVSLLAVACP